MGWFPPPAFGDATVADDALRLQSFYYGRGYFDAAVRLGGVEYLGTKAIVTYLVDAGRHYDTPTPIREICGCLLAGRHKAETEGRLDFRAELQVDPEVLTHIQAGEPFHVGRVEFSGNHHVSDSSVRRAVVLDEGALFDRGRLRQS